MTTNAVCQIPEWGIFLYFLHLLKNLFVKNDNYGNNFRFMTIETTFLYKIILMHLYRIKIII